MPTGIFYHFGQNSKRSTGYFKLPFRRRKHKHGDFQSSFSVNVVTAITILICLLGQARVAGENTRRLGT